METHMTPEREEYISRLESQIKVIENILKMDSGTVISAERKKRLRNLKEEAQIVLRKLKNNEFEIAVVGLEKAGKSTFANALMENNLLPTKDLRCTFTSTQIEYSGNDSATVSFYSSEEFNRNFKDMLSKLGIDDRKYSFDTISENIYISIYESDVSDEKKAAYGDSINEDIKAIIKYSESLSALLDSPDLYFTAGRIDSGELTKYITDEAKARAVKQVVIRSKKLHEMQNAVIFDVPGFNSPTELHRAQTLERMKSADAIIIVANGISPSLTKESLSILRESDDEGNPLGDKLFVFANKIEGARDIKQNISDTYNEWINKGFVSSANRHRIIFGSALAHLQAAGLDKDEDGNTRTLNIFQGRESLMPSGDGIEAIRQALAKYNQEERFEVLKRRTNRIKGDIIKEFSDIHSGHESVTANRTYSTEQINLILEMVHDARQQVEDKLLDLRDTIRSNMPEEQPLSKQILDYIATNITTDKYSVSDELIDKAKKRSLYTGTHEDVERIECNIREEKFKEMYGDFSRNVINIADKHHIEYSVQIIDIMLQAMGIGTGSPYHDELEALLKEQISVYRSDLHTSDQSGELYYQCLIERFSRDIYQILITSQFSTARLREFYDNIDNFYSLSVFYKKDEYTNDLSYIDIAPKDQPLCMMLLFHYYFNMADSLRIFSENICRIAGIKDLPEDVRKWAEKAFVAKNGQKEDIIDTVASEFSKIADKSDEFKINRLKQIFADIVKSNELCSVADEEKFTAYYKRYHSSLNGKLYSVDDFRREFDVDIMILQDVLTNAFVRAIRMEKPFVAREVKSIDDIIDGYIKGMDFERFISSNFYKIKYKETQLLDKQRREQEQNAAIIKEISSILDTLVN